MPPKSVARSGGPCCSQHAFSTKETDRVRKSLLSWYDKNGRDLPWRTVARNEIDDDVRGYAVWVSEVMCQQTQVATVIDYYNRWMKKWPTAKELSKASLEEVNEVWSGLGYYSRGRRLWEGAQKVEEVLEGRIPRTADKMAKELPGVGRYTAAAISSIAYNESVGLVDGNVIRVLSRMRKIGADSTSQTVIDALWVNANDLVDPGRPGDLNQSLMELGATVCSPKNPKCSQCPVSSQCLAHREVERLKDENKSKLANVKTEIQDIEDLVEGCNLCLPSSEKYDSATGVMNYPRKSRKTTVKEATSVVCILYSCEKSDARKYLLFQRPKTGLLAGLLEFPILDAETVKEESLNVKVITKRLKSRLGVGKKVTKVQEAGSYLHKFSHLKQTYLIWSAQVEGMDALKDVPFDEEKHQRSEVLSEDEIMKSAISTAMKNVFQVFSKKPTMDSKKRKASGDVKGTTAPSKQKSIDCFFKKK